MWQRGINWWYFGLVSQWDSTIKPPWVCIDRSRCLSWYDLRCCCDVKLPTVSVRDDCCPTQYAVRLVVFSARRRPEGQTAPQQPASLTAACLLPNQPTGPPRAQGVCLPCAGHGFSPRPSWTKDVHTWYCLALSVIKIWYVLIDLG